MGGLFRPLVGCAMYMLALGLVVLLGAHTLTTFRDARQRLVERIGPGGYKILFSLVSLIGLVLIVRGFSLYRAEGLVPVWTPPAALRAVTFVLMWLAFVALAGTVPARGWIRGRLRHPLLVAVKIWALAHLLANGDAGGMLLFGAFVVWGGYDRIALKRRGEAGAERVGAFTWADIGVLLAGTILYVGMLHLHPIVIGVSLIGG
jgi:uncharacterized membrane protein